MLWTIQATVTRQRTDGYSQTAQIPTFKLDEDIQGIVTLEGIERIAKDILNPFNDDSITVNVFADGEGGG